MTFTYSFTVPNLKNSTDLYNYILNIQNLPDFEMYIESTVDLTFNEELSQELLDVLTNAINNYIPATLDEFDHTESINITKSTINTTSYLGFATDYFVKKNTFLKKIIIGSSIDEGGSYQIRVYDLLNNKVITDSNILSNNHLEITSLELLSNIPESDTLIEFQCKVTVGVATIKTIHFVYHRIV